MTEPLCDSCGEWTDPATLQDGDCPGCVAVRPDKTEQALAKLERQWQKQHLTPTAPEPRCAGDAQGIYRLDAFLPLTPAQMRERGFVEPTG